MQTEDLSPNEPTLEKFEGRCRRRSARMGNFALLDYDRGGRSSKSVQKRIYNPCSRTWSHNYNDVGLRHWSRDLVGYSMLAARILVSFGTAAYVASVFLVTVGSLLTMRWARVSPSPLVPGLLLPGSELLALLVALRILI